MHVALRGGNEGPSNISKSMCSTCQWTRGARLLACTELSKKRARVHGLAGAPISPGWFLYRCPIFGKSKPQKRYQGVRGVE